MTDEPRLIDLTPDDLPRIKNLEDIVWFEVQPGGTPQDLADDLDFRHARAAERSADPLPGEPAQDRPPLVGIYSAYDLSVTVPAPEHGLSTLPMDGLTWVGVHPDARRKGLLTRLMRDHLHRIHDRGEAAIAGLTASETGIYGRSATAAPASTSSSSWVAGPSSGHRRGWRRRRTGSPPMS